MSSMSRLSLRPLRSFAGFLDLKTGALLALFFALLNKVSGAFGLIAALTGAGGSLPQLSLYVYSTIGLVAMVVALRAVTDEDGKRALYFAHLFFADHVASTAWTVFFALTWWLHTAHDGAHAANSPAQEALARTAPPGAGHMDAAERVLRAQEIWHREKGKAATLIMVGWLSKFYFALVLYSYAIHLRRGSYRSLPHSRSAGPTAQATTYAALATEDALGLGPGGMGGEEEDDIAMSLPSRSSGPGGAPPPYPGVGSDRPSHGRGHSTSRSLSNTTIGPPRAGAGANGGRNLAAEMERGIQGEDVLFDEDEDDIVSNPNVGKRPDVEAHGRR